MRQRLALLLLSAAVLAYELALMRAFSIVLWHHFAYMVISIALLGFGASGTFLALWWRPPDTDELRVTFARSTRRAFALFAILFALSLPVSFVLAQRLPFNPFVLLWDRSQILVLGAYYLIFFIPFFLAATAVGLLLVEQAREAPRVYFYNLLGSGLGSLVLVLFLYVAPPERAILLIYVLAASAALLTLGSFQFAWRAVFLTLLVATFFFFLPRDALTLHPSQYKSLSVTLNFPGAEIVEQRFSPLGRVDVLRSSAFHYAPGLSLAARATPPRQLALFLDAESTGALTRFDGTAAPLEFLDWTSSAAPFHLLADPQRARVLILGAGGGSDLLLALYHGSAHIEGVELNPQIISLVRETHADFTGHLYDRPEVELHIEEARGFLERTARAGNSGRRFNLIQMSLLDSLAASTAGVHALNENYLYTVEAFLRLTDLLTNDGIVAITRWLSMPPRDTLKLMATMVEALEARAGARPSEQLALVRSWSTATLLVKRTPFTPQELAALKQFCQERLFDLDYYPGIEPQEANRFNRLERSYYLEAATEILAGGARRATFLRNYPFYIEPATDDRPYFQHFLRWRTLPLLLRSYGQQWLPFLEWGYLILVATLAQAALLSLALILLPLFISRSGPAGPPNATRGSRLPVFAYFLAIGLGYLFIEIVLIQKFTFFLANPIYAAAVVLSGVLMFSGLGSGAASLLAGEGAHKAGRAALACACVAGVGVLAALLLPVILPALVGLPLSARVVLSLLLMAPLAFLMGMPFPLAWQRLEAARPDWLPWAWGVNGCASVLSTLLATLTAMSFGFRIVLFAASAFYLLAAGVARAFPPATHTIRT